MVYLGETHGEPAVVGLHTAVLDTLVSQVHDFKKNQRDWDQTPKRQVILSSNLHRRQKREVQMQEFQSLWNISVLSIRYY